MILTLDFETLPIQKHPEYPPKPVGLAVKENNGDSFYMSWGHPSGNNCNESDCRDTLESIYSDVHRGATLLFHNAKFDLAVARRWFGLRPPPAARIRDTLIEAFLVNPHGSKVGLKSLAEHYLNWPPEERDAVVDWLCANLRTQDGKRLSDKPKSQNYAGAYIAYAPGELVGQYARGDVDRTFELHLGFEQYIQEAGMMDAYYRELQVLAITMENELSGMRIDLQKAEQAYTQCMQAVELVDSYARRAVGKPDLNVGSAKQLGPELVRCGIVDPTKLLKTDKGSESLSADSLALAADPIWAKLLKYRANMLTVGNTFIKNWLEQGRRTNGIIYTTWNQVAQERGGHGAGTRTGRFSSEPSFLNIPKRVGDTAPPEGLSELLRCELPPVPYVRGLVIPWEPGWYLINRDYSQQEVRILGHFGGGSLLKQYQDDPWMDVYDWFQAVAKSSYGFDLGRGIIKTIVLGVMYGRGPKAIAAALEIDPETAKQLRALVLQIIPELASMYAEVEARARQGKPIRTWGGRLYYCEDSEKDQPGRKALAYKMVNNIIQPSAADCTKQAWINLGNDPQGFKTYLTVHDEFLASVHPDQLHSGMERLRKAMTDVSFDLEMKSEGKAGATDWAHLKPYDKKGKYVFTDEKE